MKSLVSILVPVYGVEKFIEKCAISLFEQDYDNIEYIFVDDCSPDGSVNILNDVISRYPQCRHAVKIIAHEQNKGLAMARKTGLDSAEGDYVMFVDSDDYICSSTISKCINKISQDNSDMVVIGFNHIFSNKNHIVCPYEELMASDYLELALERKINVNVCGNLFKRSLFTDTGISFVEGINFGEDYVVGTRLLYFVNKISFLSEPLYNYVHYNLSSYTNSFQEKHIDQLLNAERIIFDFYKDKDEKLKSCQKVGRVKLKAEMLTMLLRQGSYSDRAYKRLIDLFKEDCKNPRVLEKLNAQDRGIISISRMNNKVVLSFVIRYGFKLKQLLK